VAERGKVRGKREEGFDVNRPTARIKP